MCVFFNPFLLVSLIRHFFRLGVLIWYVAITTEDSFYILRFDRDSYNANVEDGAGFTNEGVEELLLKC